ncbi:MAG TPA: xanthine dehydrogenase family protein subunit M [Leeuwenhoekiella sp.]|nr:xanthine dehydrogenase family protein subunit M [Leeuwenhoekiella sp.]
MRPFTYTKTEDTAQATSKLAANENAKYLAGGTNLLDLMKEDVERPDELVDIGLLDLTDIKETSTGVSLGAMAKNTETANHPLVRKNFPMLSLAILAGASGQIRNMATNGGNPNQRTRCAYFFDTAMPCNKREPGTGCGALEGQNHMHAIFGWNENCVAVHPSDMCIALAALDATVTIADGNGKTRTIPFTEYHRLPGDQPERDNNLERGELITSIEIPKNNFAKNSYYVKVRDRSSYAFALISVGAGLELQGKTIKNARIAMGGVAHKPWRAYEAEQFLKGKEATEENFEAAADAEMANAKTLEHNAFKVPLGKQAMVRALNVALSGEKV